MTPNPDRNQRRTGAAEGPSTETGGDGGAAPSETNTDDATDHETNPDGAVPPETALTRRHTLVGAGLGLGLLSGLRRTAPEQGQRQWKQDVDAGGNDLLDLGGLNMDSMADGALVTALDGANLAIDDGRLNAVTHWRRRDDLLEPSDDDVDGIEVEDVESPDEEALNLEADADLVLSISGGEGAVRIETEGGHEIVLDDADGSESISVEDSAGNSVEMDATTGEVSISATDRIALDAPQIDISADANVNIDSDGLATLRSSGITSILGGLVKVNGPGQPAARVGDAVEDGHIVAGSTTVLIG